MEGGLPLQARCSWSALGPTAVAVSGPTFAIGPGPASATATAAPAPSPRALRLLFLLLFYWSSCSCCRPGLTITRGCFTNSDGLSDQATDHTAMDKIMGRWFIAQSDSPQLLVKQPPGSMELVRTGPLR